MKVFMDDSGNSFNWETDISAQPYYVLSAVCVPDDVYPDACEEIRTSITNLHIPEMSNPMGQGFEIKARDIARGKGWWQNHTNERNEVIDLMLSFPLHN